MEAVARLWRNHGNHHLLPGQCALRLDVQLAPYPIELEGKVWPTSEHYFQAGKFPGSDYAEAIRQQRSPMIAARMGRSREGIRDARGGAVKFTQHADLRALLLQTGDALLVEHTANDSYWADGGDGSGLNRLGVILAVRAQLRCAM